MSREAKERQKTVKIDGKNVKLEWVENGNR